MVLVQPNPALACWQAFHIVAAQHHMAEARAKARAQGAEEAKGVEVVKNGNICKGYRWTQELPELTVSVDLPPGTTKRDVVCKFSMQARVPLLRRPPPTAHRHAPLPLALASRDGTPDRASRVARAHPSRGGAPLVCELQPPPLASVAARFTCLLAPRRISPRGCAANHQSSTAHSSPRSRWTTACGSYRTRTS